MQSRYVRHAFVYSILPKSRIEISSSLNKISPNSTQSSRTSQRLGTQHQNQPWILLIPTLLSISWAHKSVPSFHCHVIVIGQDTTRDHFSKPICRSLIKVSTLRRPRIVCSISARFCMVRTGNSLEVSYRNLQDFTQGWTAVSVPKRLFTTTWERLSWLIWSQRSFTKMKIRLGIQRTR